MRALEPSVSFALVTPDGVLSDGLSAVTNGLQKYQIETLTAQLIPLKVEIMQAVYSDVAFRLREANGLEVILPNNVFSRLYEIGPACLLTVIGKTPDLWSQMAMIKGATRPTDAEPNSIRSSGENIVLNFVHFPDDPEAVTRELQLLVGRQRAELLLQPNERDSFLMRVLSLQTVREALPGFFGREALSLPWIANRLRLRIAQRVAGSAADDGKRLEELWVLVCELRHERTQMVRAVSTRDLSEIAQRSNKGLNGRLRAMALDLDIQECVRLITILDELTTSVGSREPTDKLDKGFNREIYLSQLEMLTIDTHSLDQNREHRYTKS